MGTTWTPSIIEAWQCPRQGHALILDLEKHGKRRGTGPALIGQLVHEAIASYLRDGKIPISFNTAPQDVKDMVDWFIRIYPIEELYSKTHLIEFTIGIDIDGVRIGGTPDLSSAAFEDGIKVMYIEDWKTNYATYSDEQVESRLQLKFYALVNALLTLDAEKFELTYWFLRHGVKKSMTFSRQEILDLAPGIVLMIKSFEAMTEFPAIPGKACHFCEVAASCPDVAIDDESTIMEKAVAWLKAKRQVDQLKAELEDYVDLYGPIDIDGGKIGYTVTQQREIVDVPAIIDVLLNHDIDRSKIWDSVKMNVGALDKLTGKDKALQELVAKFVGKKTKTQFGLK